MMTSATKSEEKRRDWSVQRGVDHNKIRVNQAVETRNRAQFLGQVPKQQRKSYRRLARGTKHRQHARKGILLGECRIRSARNSTASYSGIVRSRMRSSMSCRLLAILRPPSPLDAQRSSACPRKIRCIPSAIAGSSSTTSTVGKAVPVGAATAY